MEGERPFWGGRVGDNEFGGVGRPPPWCFEVGKDWLMPGWPASRGFGMLREREWFASAAARLDTGFAEVEAEAMVESVGDEAKSGGIVLQACSECYAGATT